MFVITWLFLVAVVTSVLAYGLYTAVEAVLAFARAVLDGLAAPPATVNASPVSAVGVTV